MTLLKVWYKTLSENKSLEHKVSRHGTIKLFKTTKIFNKILLYIQQYISKAVYFEV